MKKPSILIPSPYVAENHQHKNAEELKNNFATCLITQDLLNKSFGQELIKLINNHKYRKKLSENIAQFSSDNAEKVIAKEINQLLKKNNSL